MCRQARRRFFKNTAWTLWWAYVRDLLSGTSMAPSVCLFYQQRVKHRWNLWWMSPATHRDGQQKKVAEKGADVSFCPMLCRLVLYDVFCFQAARWALPGTFKQPSGFAGCDSRHPDSSGSSNRRLSAGFALSGQPHLCPCRRQARLVRRINKWTYRQYWQRQNDSAAMTVK